MIKNTFTKEILSYQVDFKFNNEWYHIYYTNDKLTISGSNGTSHTVDIPDDTKHRLIFLLDELDIACNNYIKSKFTKIANEIK